MKCEKCDKEIDEQNKFCPYCGTKILKVNKNKIPPIAIVGYACGYWHILYYFWKSLMSGYLGFSYYQSTTVQDDIYSCLFLIKAILLIGFAEIVTRLNKN